MYQNFKYVLYHGTIANIEKIDISQGKGRKDFGKGFYMAVSRSQAVGMMHKKYKEAVRRSRNKRASDFTEHLYQIELDDLVVKSLNIRFFEQADEDWLDFVLMCREKGGIPHHYDMVIGPKADDDTMLCLKTYWDGLYGVVGSLEAKKILLNNLETENLGIQYFIGKQEVVDSVIKSIKEVDWR